jgi:hypothetical protein
VPAGVAEAIIKAAGVAAEDLTPEMEETITIMTIAVAITTTTELVVETTVPMIDAVAESVAPTITFQTEIIIIITIVREDGIDWRLSMRKPMTNSSSMRPSPMPTFVEIHVE